MAFADTTWYCNSVGHAAVAVRPQNTAVTVGMIRRQFTAPAVGSERCFICIVAGTTANVTDATWVLTRGAKTVDGTATWMECTGQAALNADNTNVHTWATYKTVTASPSLGVIIKRNNGASYQICTTAGVLGVSEPSFSDTAGTTATDNTAVWTSLGVVGNFTTKGAAPFARIVAACAANWFAAGNTVWIGDDHAESQGSTLSPTPATSVSLIGKFICHDHLGSYPPTAGDLATGATISTTGTSTLNLSGSAGNSSFYWYGVTFKAGVGGSGSGSLTVTANGNWVYFDRCGFEVATTGSSAGMSISGTVDGIAIFNNSTVKFSHISQEILISFTKVTWKNTGQILAAGSSVPDRLFTPSGAGGVSVVCEAVDLSQIAGTLFDVGSMTSSCLIKDCKLHASVTVATPTVPATIQFVRSAA